jgi:hypothetical protein
MAKAVSLKTLFLAGAALVALAPAAALAHEPPSVVLNGQVNFSDVQGLVVVNAAAAHGVTAPAAALGNTMSARAAGRGMDITSNQELGADVLATSRIGVDQARGVTVGTAVAQGNAAQAEACCADLTVNAAQTVREGSDIAASSVMQLGSADTVASAASGTANAWGISSNHGYVDSYVLQRSAGNVTAVSSVTACCNNNALTSGATAAGNSAQIYGEAATVYLDTVQQNSGAITGVSRVNVGSATNVTSAASAAANTARIDNRWGYAQMAGYQENSGQVEAISEVHLGDWGGFAVSGSNALGNSAMVSNLGSDATLDIVQNNFATGGVSSFASLEGSSSRGGVGVVTATAMGNAATVYACQTCGEGSVKVEGYVSQYNYAPVTATAVVGVGSAGAITASATAVGNSASFIAQQGGGH